METKEKEISLLTFWQVFCRCLWWLVIACVIGGAVGFLYCRFVAQPRYSTTAQFVVESTNNSATILGSSYQTGMENKAANIIEVVTGNVFLEKVAQEYNTKYGTNFTAAQLAARVTASTKTGTAAFRIKVSASNPEEAYNLLKIFEERVPSYLVDYSEEADKYFKDENTGEMKQPFFIMLTQRGMKPQSPESPRVMISTALCAIGFALIVYLVFFFTTLFDKTVYETTELKENLGLPALGEIPEWAQKGKTVKDAIRERVAIKKELRGKQQENTRDYTDRILSENTSFAVSEAFKALRTNLVYAAAEEGTPVIGMLSAYSGAGKSLLVSNCAVSFSQLGKKVLLIDADMRCPSLAQIFKLDKKAQGLSEYLAGLQSDASAKALAQKTAYDGLDLITSGRIPPNPSELLSSKRLDTLLQSAKETYDYVFIDLPPVRATSDACAIASSITGFLLVTRYAYSDLRVVMDSVDAVRSVNGKILGFVINDLPCAVGSYGGKYAKYGKYGKYARYGKYNRYSRYSRYSTSAAGVEAPEKKA